MSVNFFALSFLLLLLLKKLCWLSGVARSILGSVQEVDGSTLLGQLQVLKPSKQS